LELTCLCHALGTAALTFGKFQEKFLKELHFEILNHARQEDAGHLVQAPAGMTVVDSDILEPDPVRQGGLMRPESVREPLLPLCSIT
jgi:pre-mRNA-splicing factor ATP-dependent RNA helicase DHX38/PRP16